MSLPVRVTCFVYEGVQCGRVELSDGSEALVTAMPSRGVVEFFDRFGDRTGGTFAKPSEVLRGLWSAAKSAVNHV